MDSTPKPVQQPNASSHEDIPKLYRELASWWPLLSAPADYAEEAEFYRQALLSAAAGPLVTVLELGSGGGNNASHLKAHFTITLVDRSENMLQVSRSLNPGLEHFQGDMRTVRLERTFDAVFIHDAICYLTGEAGLEAALATAFVHLRPGGVALFAPDHVRETFRPATRQGGHDSSARSLRYLEWVWDPDPDDTSYVADFAYLLREAADGSVRVVHDRHTLGIFPRAGWLRLLRAAGFQPSVMPFVHSMVELGSSEVFIAVKPDG